MLLLVMGLGFWLPCQWVSIGDDDFSLMYLGALSVLDDPATEALSSQALACVAGAGYAEVPLHRLGFRLDHRSNYIIHAPAIAAVRQAVAPQVDVANPGASLTRVLGLGLFLGQILVATAALLALWWNRSSRHVALLALVVAIHGMGAALWLALAPLHAYIGTLAEHGSGLLAFLLRAGELTGRQFITAFLGFSPRGAFCLLILLAYSLRCSDRPRAGYAVALLSGLVHGSLGYLLLISLLAIDLLRAPGRLRDPVVIAVALLGPAGFALRDQAWQHLGLGAIAFVLPAALFLPSLALLLARFEAPLARLPGVSALRRLPGVSALRRLPEDVGSLWCVIVLALLAWVALKSQGLVLEGGVLDALGHGHARLLKVLTTLLLVAGIDVWLRAGGIRGNRVAFLLVFLVLALGRPLLVPAGLGLLAVVLVVDFLRSGRRYTEARMMSLAVTALSIAAASLLLAGLFAKRPEPRPLADIASLPPQQLQSWIAESRLEGVDGLVFSSIILDRELGNAAVARFCDALSTARPAARQ